MRLLACLMLVSVFSYAAENGSCPQGPSRLVVDKGEYSSRPGIVFVLENFYSTLVPRGNRPPLCQMKMTEVEGGHVIVSGATLTKLFDDKVEAKKSQPVSDVSVHIENDEIVISGKVHKLVSIPFTIEGPVEAVDGRAIRLRAQKIKAAGLPVKGLLGMVGVHLGSLINPHATKGVTVEENAIIFEPEKLANVRGRLTSVHLAGNSLLVDFGSPHAQDAKGAERQAR